MSDVKNIRIAKNKIDRIEDFSFPSQNMIGNITLEGNDNFSNQLYMFSFTSYCNFYIEMIDILHFRKPYFGNSISECA